jgi:hypothetical protein
MATTTPNFGWAVPTSTDLVKDGAVAIETLGDSIDASLVDLKGGTTGQVLKKATNTDMDFVWSADSAGMTNPMTTTGDTIYSSSGSTPARLGIGTTGQVLTVASGVPSWATPAAGGSTFVGCELRKSANQTISDATDAIVTFDVETFDTDGFHSTSSNTGRITIPTGKGGKYRFSYTHRWFGNSTGFRNTGIKINGVSGASYNTVLNLTSTRLVYNGSYVLDLSAGDYVEMVVYQNSGGNLDLLYEENSQLNAGVRFGCEYLGA